MKLLRFLDRWILPVLFFGLLALPIAWFGRPSFAPAALHENRRLEPFPARVSIRWFENIEHWFSDNYGMRDALVHYGSRLQMARTGRPVNQNVVIGQDDWLFFDEHYQPGQPHMADKYGRDPLSSGELEAIARNLGQADESLRACGVPFYVVVAPDKEAIYPDKLNPPAPADAVTQADQMMAYLRMHAPKVQVLDLREALHTARREQAYDVYKRTDTHWNTLGAFFGYQAIARRLVADGVLSSAPRADLAGYRVSRERFPGGDIAVNLLDLPGYFEDYLVRLDPLVPRTAHPEGEDDRTVQMANPQASGTLLLFRDSFAEELTPFLAEDFGRIDSHLEHRLDGALVHAARPTAVMLEIVQRNVRRLREGPQRLEQACGK